MLCPAGTRAPKALKRLNEVLLLLLFCAIDGIDETEVVVIVPINDTKLDCCEVGNALPNAKKRVAAITVAEYIFEI
ncbi:hypothetical protein HK100_010947, partial [Physocladia obscura]